MILHYIKVALRNLWKYKTQSLINIIGLTVGFASFSLGGYWWYWENHFDKFQPHSDHTYAITMQGIVSGSDGSPVDLNQLPKEDAEFFIQAIPQIEDYSRIQLWHWMYYEKEGTTSNLMGMCVDEGFFRIFSNDFISGGINAIPFDRSYIVLTRKAAEKYAQKIDCAGEVFQTTNGSYTIAGVIEDYPTNTEFRFEYLILSEENYNHNNRSSFYVLLNKHSDVSSVEEKVREHKSMAVERYNPEAPKQYTFHLRSLPEVHLMSNPELFPRFRNIRLLGIAGLLAVICALMNCLTVFIGQQQRKHGQNKTFRSIGASRAYLFTKSLLDLLLSLVIAFLLFILAAYLLFPFYQDYTRWQGYGVYENYAQRMEIIPLLSFSLKNIALILTAFLALSVVFIRMMISGKNTHPALFRNALIVGQIFIGCFFFFISLSLYKQFYFTEKKDKGINVENISQIHLGYDGFDSENLSKELLQSPFVEDVTFMANPILTREGDLFLSYIGSVEFIDKPYEEIRGVDILVVEPNFNVFFDIKLKEGSQLKSSNEVLINESMQKNFKEKHVLRSHVNAGLAKEVVVAGVIKDFNYSSMYYPLKPLIFHFRIPDNDLIDYQYVYIKSSPENRQRAHEYAQKVLADHGFDKVEILELSDIQEEFNRPEKELSRLFGFLSFICILIVSAGIYSLVTFTMEQRRKEIAIRKINGATIKDILFLFIKKYLLLLILGNLLALPVAYKFINDWLESYAYRVGISWWIPLPVFLFTCLIVLASILETVRKAAKENPVEALKIES